MTYSHTALRGLGATGDRFSVGQEVTARFTPHGVGAANQAATFAALSAAMARTGVFNTPTYLGWGSADNAGLVVFKGKTKTDAFTAKQVADKMPGVVADTTRALGAGRLSFVSIRAPVPTGPAAGGAAQPSTSLPGVPDVAPPAEAQPGDVAQWAPQSSGATTEAPGFFAREVGGVPVWALGAGVLVLGAGLVFVATRKKTAPAALAANTKRKRRYLDSAHGKQRVARELGVTAADIASWIADPSIGERETMHMYRQARGSKSASRSLQRIRNARRTA